MRVTRPFAFACSAVLLLITAGPIGQAVLAAPSQPSAFDALFSQYVLGDAEAAAHELASWGDERVEREAPWPLTERDPWTQAAYASLHTEAAFVARVLGEPRTDRGVWSGSRDDYEVHTRRAYRLVDSLREHAEREADAELLEFCRRWYVLTGMWEPAHRRFPEDAELRLLQAASHERGMGPRLPANRRGDGTGPGMSVLPDVRSSHGHFNRDKTVNAERGFRDVLERDPSLVEARLRLGHVYYLLDRTEEARAEWEATLGSSRGLADPSVSYLASLFLGQLHEDAGRTAEAEAAYRAATAILPEGQVARVALGRLQLVEGESDGWTTLRTVFDEQTNGREDPFDAYGRIGRAWGFGGDASMTALRRVALAGLRGDPTTHRAALPVVPGSSRPSTIRPLPPSVTLRPVSAARPAATRELSVAIVFDLSPSAWSDRGLDDLLRGAEVLLSSLQPTDRVWLVSFAEAVTLRTHAPMSPREVARLLPALGDEDEPPSVVHTRLWDAVLAGAALAVGQRGRPVIMLLSDGADNASWSLQSMPHDAKWMKNQRDETIAIFEGAGVTLDTIWKRSWFSGGDGVWPRPSPQEPSQLLGGAAFHARVDDLGDRLARRIEELRQAR